MLNLEIPSATTHIVLGDWTCGYRVSSLVAEEISQLHVYNRVLEASGQTSLTEHQWSQLELSLPVYFTGISHLRGTDNASPSHVFVIPSDRLPTEPRSLVEVIHDIIIDKLEADENLLGSSDTGGPPGSTFEVRADFVRQSTRWKLWCATEDDDPQNHTEQHVIVASSNLFPGDTDGLRTDQSRFIQAINFCFPLGSENFSRRVIKEVTATSHVGTLVYTSLRQERRKR